MNQREKVLAMLKTGPVCGTDFLAAYVPRYSARILELRQQGHVIESRPCRNGWHQHETAQTVYELAVSDQLRLSV